MHYMSRPLASLSFERERGDGGLRALLAAALALVVRLEPAARAYASAAEEPGGGAKRGSRRLYYIYMYYLSVIN